MDVADLSATIYLGDSVYARAIPGAIELTTRNGLPTDPSNVIVLEPQVLDALFRFAARNDARLS